VLRVERSGMRVQRGSSVSEKVRRSQPYIKNNKLIIAVMKFAVNEINNAFGYFIFNSHMINKLSTNKTAISTKKKLSKMF